MSYQPLISTLAGGFICWILVMFCFDVAVRSVKLGFLRMIAPIPIISRIDPKKGMDTFNKWVKSCTSTYLDLFIRLLAIYFAVFVISLVGDMNFVDASTGLPADVNAFVKIFIIMGALLFAKQLPQLIEELTGMKMSGKFTLDPRKKLGEVPLVGGAAAAGLTMAGGAALALGRGAANMAGGGIKTGLGAGISAFTGGRYGAGLKASGRRTLGNTANAMRTRMDYTREESYGRFRASGLVGNEYKGTTAHQMYDKDRENARTKRNEGRKEFNAIDRQWQIGEEARNNLANQLGVAPAQAFNFFDGTTRSAYNAAYTNEEFINSLMAVDKQDAITKKYTNAYEAIRLGQTVTVNGRTYDGSITTDVTDFNDDYVKAQKTLKGLESVHDTMRKTYSADAEIQDGIKFNKYNPINPTNP